MISAFSSEFSSVVFPRTLSSFIRHLYDFGTFVLLGIRIGMDRDYTTTNTINTTIPIITVTGVTGNDSFPMASISVW